MGNQASIRQSLINIYNCVLEKATPLNSLLKEIDPEQEKLHKPIAKGLPEPRGKGDVFKPAVAQIAVQRITRGGPIVEG